MIYFAYHHTTLSSYIHLFIIKRSLTYFLGQKPWPKKKNLITTCKKKVQGGVFAVYGWKNPYIEMKKCNGFSFKQKQQQQQFHDRFKIVQKIVVVLFFFCFNVANNNNNKEKKMSQCRCIHHHIILQSYIC